MVLAGGTGHASRGIFPVWAGKNFVLNQLPPNLPSQSKEEALAGALAPGRRSLQGTDRRLDVEHVLKVGANASLRSQDSAGLLQVRRAVTKAISRRQPVDRHEESALSGLEKLLKKEMSSFLYWGSVNLLAVGVAYWEIFHRHANYAPEELSSSESVLPENLWALNLVASVGQARIGRYHLSPIPVLLVSCLMGFMQISVLCLVVHDIDPNAPPITTEPASPWVEGSWSVNCMKWLMVLFLGIFMVRESVDASHLLRSIFTTNRKRFEILPKMLLASVAMFQYVIVIMIIWGGVAAVLSFQAVPDILYSSMSVTFIAKVDEAFYVLIENVFDVEADFTIVHSRRHDDSWTPRSDAPMQRTLSTRSAVLESICLEAEKQKSDEHLEPEPVPMWAEILMRYMVLFPLFFSLGLIVRAFYTNVKPSTRIHRIKDSLEYVWQLR